jgi:transcriptional regulator with XRE-family HTH domain
MRGPEHPVGRYRRAKGWTQADLAKELGVTTNAVLAWEKGAEPRPARFPRLAEVLGVGALQLHDEIESWRGRVQGAA